MPHINHQEPEPRYNKSAHKQHKNPEINGHLTKPIINTKNQSYPLTEHPQKQLPPSVINFNAHQGNGYTNLEETSGGIVLDNFEELT